MVNVLCDITETFRQLKRRVIYTEICICNLFFIYWYTFDKKSVITKTIQSMDTIYRKISLCFVLRTGICNNIYILGIFYPRLSQTWRRAWQPTPAFLPGEFHGQRSLAGYRPWGPKESDMTEQLSLGTITINRSLNYPWVCHFHPFTFNTSVCLERTSCKQHIAVLLIFTEFDIISFNSAFTMIVAQLVKNLPAMWEIWVQSLGWEDPLE